MKYKFICPLFQIRIYLVLGDKKQLKAFHVYEEDYNDAETHSVEVENKDGLESRGLLVWLAENDDYYGMVHETVHLVKRAFEITGIPFDETNDEIIAYYQNYWVRRFWNKMCKFIKDEKDDNVT